MLLGFKKPDASIARIFGREAAANRKTVFEKVGVQLQSTAYQPSVTVEECCLAYASLYKNPADYRALLTTFGLEAHRRSRVSGLSGGERQKLSGVTLPCEIFPS